MNNLGGFRNGHDRSSSLFEHVKVMRRDLDAPPAHLSSDRLAGLVGGVEFTPAASTVDEDVQNAEPAIAEPAEDLWEAADEVINIESDVTVPAAIKDDSRTTTEVSETDSGGLDAVARMLAMAQKLHDGYVTEGRDARDKLITEGQSHHDKVVAEATKQHEELLSAGRAKYDEFVSVGEAMHDTLIADAREVVANAAAEHERMITEARTASNQMVADAQHKSTEVLEELTRESSLRQKGIEELRTFEDDHRARMSHFLKEQLAYLEQSATNEEG